MRFQSGLGEFQASGRADLNNGGKISLARVVKVYNEKNSADVMLITNDFIGDNDDTEGRISCIQVASFAGWDDTLKVAYGTITPLHEGQYVFIAYVDAMKEQAIIIGSLTPHVKEFNNLPFYRSEEGLYPKEKYEHLSVTKNQDYNYLNSEGEFEKVSSSRAFIVGQKEKMSDSRDSEFNYENLSIKNKVTEKTIGLEKEDMDFRPFNYLAVTKDRFEDKGATFNRFYHDAEKGITRFTKDDDKKVFYLQLDEKNNFEIRSHLDTNKREIPSLNGQDGTLRQSDTEIQGSTKENTTGSNTQDFTSIKIADNGTIIIERKDPNSGTKIEIKPNEIDIKIGQTSFKLTENGVDLKSADINITGMAKYKGREIAVKGDSTTCGAVIV